jgi:hypothetical protein
MEASERGASAVASGDHQRAIQACEEPAAVTPMDAAAQEQMSTEKAIIAARESMAASTPAGRNAIDVSTPSDFMSSYSNTLASYGISYGELTSLLGLGSPLLSLLYGVHSNFGPVMG